MRCPEFVKSFFTPPENQETSMDAAPQEFALPAEVQSLCPECLSTIDGQLYEKDGQVWMEKTCPTHGVCRELISTDATFYRLLRSRDRATLPGVLNPLEGKQAACPHGCGPCDQHRSPPVMVNIDLTNRCNLNCPVCFANAKARGAVVEVSMEQLEMMLDRACEQSKATPVCLQYAGGEPTMHPHFLDALRAAQERDFAQIQAATNGIAFARDAGFTQAASEAGLNVAYLQFDGLSDEVYRRTRGRPLLETKLKAIENMSAAGIRTVLVPTIVKGVNDDQIGAIARFAVERVNDVAGVSWQPVAFTGRIDYAQRVAQRFTLADLARELEHQFGPIKMYRDWYPFSFVDPYSRMVEAATGTPQTHLSCNAACGCATYLVVDEETREVFSLPSFVDPEPLMAQLQKTVDRLHRHRLLAKLTLRRALRALARYYHEDRAPRGWDFDTFVTFMMDFVDFRRRYSDNHTRRVTLDKLPYRSLLFATMHFQDAYNYQIDRVQRCVVQYAAPDGRLYPFCTYNSGPCHRDRVEKQFSVSPAEYRAEQNRQTPAPSQ